MLKTVKARRLGATVAALLVLAVSCAVADTRTPLELRQAADRLEWGELFYELYDRKERVAIVSGPTLPTLAQLRAESARRAATAHLRF